MDSNHIHKNFTPALHNNSNTLSVYHSEYLAKIFILILILFFKIFLESIIISSKEIDGSDN
ncbi:hypothetical protein HOB94_00595 [bacterium]|nr:hypothetical protein [bacterium]MBT6778684.1 hypothetical protein [bacterium]